MNALYYQSNYSRSSGNSPMAYEEVVSLARHNIWDAMTAVRHQTRSAEEGVTAAMYAESAVAFVYAQLLLTEDECWKQCAHQPVWNGRSLDRSNALPIAFKVVNLAFEKGPRYERARYHAKALR